MLSVFPYRWHLRALSLRPAPTLFGVLARPANLNVRSPPGGGQMVEERLEKRVTSSLLGLTLFTFLFFHHPKSCHMSL